MKKQVKYLIAGGIVLVLLIVSLIFLKQWAGDSSSSSSESSSEGAFTSESVYLNEGKTIKEIESISFTNPDGDFTITQTDPEKTVFMMEQLKDTPYDESILNGVGSFTSTFYASDTIAKPEDGDINWTLYGLDNPTTQVTSHYTDGTSFTVQIGSKAPGNMGYYGKVLDGDTVYLFNKSDVEPYTENLTYYINKELAPDFEDYAFGYFTGMTVDGAGTGVDGKIVVQADTEITEENQDTAGTGVGDFLITAPKKSQTDSEYLEDMLNTIFPLKAESVLAVNPTKEQLAEYGLENPNLIYHIDYENDDGEAQVFELMCSPIKNGYFYASPLNSSVIYKIAAPTEDRNFVTLTYSKLVHKLFIVPYLNKLSEIKVTANGEVYDFGITPSPEDESDTANYSITCNGSPVKISSFTKFYQVLIGARKDSILTESFNPSGDPILKVEYTYRDGSGVEVVEFHPIESDKRRVGVSVNGKFEFTARTTYVNKVISDIQKVLNGESISTDF